MNRTAFNSATGFGRAMILAMTLCLLSGCAGSGASSSPQESAKPVVASRQVSEMTVVVSEGDRSATPEQVSEHLVKQIRRHFPSMVVEEQTAQRFSATIDARDISKSEPSVKAPSTPTMVRLVYEFTPVSTGGVRTTGRALLLGESDLSQFPEVSQMVGALPLAMLWSGLK